MDYAGWGLLVIMCAIVLVYLYIFTVKDIFEYRKAKTNIFAFVESHKRKCTGNNRFVVTVESLQDSFREYETKIIQKVWLDLISARLIERDPLDQVWCIR